MPDARDFVKRLNAKLKTKFTYDEIFIDFKEGSRLFPDRKAWQNPEHYPAMRLDMRDGRLHCRFLTNKDECGVHDVRPETCRKYYCEHLRKVLLGES